jgi:O-antigen ligase
LLISSLVSKWRQGRSGEKIWYVFLITILLLSLILSRARGWVLGLFFGLTALWVIPLVKKKDFVPLVVIVIISLFLGSFLMLTHNTLLTFIKNDFEISETSRLCLAKRALELFREHPFKGIGTDMFYWDWQPPARTHNIFLEMTVTIGVFGLLALLWFLGSLFRIIGKGICKDSDFKKDSIQIGVLGSLASFLGHNLVDYFWNLHKIIGLFWILAGIGVCAYLVREK